MSEKDQTKLRGTIFNKKLEPDQFQDFPMGTTVGVAATSEVNGFQLWHYQLQEGLPGTDNPGTTVVPRPVNHTWDREQVLEHAVKIWSQLREKVEN